MRKAFWLFLLLALAVASAWLARLHHGFVIIVLPPWRIELPFLLAALLALLLSWSLLFVWRILRGATRLPEKFRRKAAADS